MSVMSSPQRTLHDSPSRQLIHELNRLLISDQDRFLSQLDKENEQQEKIHRQALAAAAKQHEKVRESVELERRRLDAQIQAERERREAQAREELERHRREKAEREIEERKREAERQKAVEEEQRQIADIERSERETKEAAKAERKKREEDNARRTREQQQAQQQQQQAVKRHAQAAVPRPPASEPTTAAKSPPSASTPITEPSATSASSQAVVARDSRLEEEHGRYLDIHKRLKELRNFMAEEGKKNKVLKDVMGSMRREVRKSVGQLTEGKGANKPSLSNILTVLKKSLTLPGPSVPVPPFLAQPPEGATQNGTGPALLLYLLNIFSKAIVSQWIDEAGVSPKAADPVGIIASHIFAHMDFKWHNTSLISILLAQLHQKCPILFGIYGPEDTQRGKQRLGWWKDENGYLSRQRHYERMTGLAAGFAALSLRNYEKSKLQNPFPSHHYWTSLALIANTPTAELTQTHFVVLKGMVEHYESKFIREYGSAAVAALRVLLVELPTRLPPDQRGGVAVRGVQALVEVLKKDAHLVL